MTGDVTNDLLLEHLKSIQGQLSELSAAVDDIKSDNHAHRTVSTGLMQTDTLHGSQIAGIQTRIERIERRLELSEDVT